MAVTYYKEDILPQVGGPDSLITRASSINGCITLLGVLKICYSLSTDSVSISAELDTPFGTASLGSCTLNLQHTECVLGVDKWGFKAQVTISFDFSTLVLTLCGKVCAPFVGCKEGCTSIHL